MVRQTSSGITFLELLIALSIVLILASTGFPIGYHLLQETRATVAINHLQQILNFARLTAVSEGRKVTYCGASNQKVCDGAWSSYQIIFIDNNGNQQLDSDEELIRIYLPPKHVNFHYQGFPSDQWIIFNPSGYNQQHNGTFTYCSGDSKRRIKKQLVINTSGRTRVIENINSFCS